MLSTTLPFSGFYDSLHSCSIDDAEQQMFSVHATGCHRNEGLEMQLYRTCSYRDVHNAYAKEYCENFALKFELTLEFEELVSPKEYNFTTDRIFAKISNASAQMIFDQADKVKLNAHIRKRHSSRDGFYSFYANSLEAWPDNVLGWDHNQLGTLLEFFVGEDFYVWAESSLMEDSVSNGFLDTAISNATPNIERLFKIHDYLELRANREEVTA